MTGKRIWIPVVLALLVLSAGSAACLRKTDANSPVVNAAKSTPQKTGFIKPKADVVSVGASTVGLVDDYTVIVEGVIINSGAEGVVIVNAKITQGASEWVKQQPVFMPKGSSQTVRFVFPIKWKGGDWTPEVWTEIP